MKIIAMLRNTTLMHHSICGHPSPLLAPCMGQAQKPHGPRWHSLPQRSRQTCWYKGNPSSIQYLQGGCVNQILQNITLVLEKHRKLQNTLPWVNLPIYYRSEIKYLHYFNKFARIVPCSLTAYLASWNSLQTKSPNRKCESGNISS